MGIELAAKPLKLGVDLFPHGRRGFPRLWPFFPRSLRFSHGFCSWTVGGLENTEFIVIVNNVTLYL